MIKIIPIFYLKTILNNWKRWKMIVEYLNVEKF